MACGFIIETPDRDVYCAVHEHRLSIIRPFPVAHASDFPVLLYCIVELDVPDQSLLAKVPDTPS